MGPRATGALEEAFLFRDEALERVLRESFPSLAVVFDTDAPLGLLSEGRVLSFSGLAR